jgi:hypothetical protein
MKMNLISKVNICAGYESKKEMAKLGSCGILVIFSL